VADEAIGANRDRMQLPMVGMGLEVRSSAYLRKAGAEPGRAREFLKLARVAAQASVDVWESLSHREEDGLFSSNALLAVACHRLAHVLPPNDAGLTECREKAIQAKRRALEFASHSRFLAAKGDVLLQEVLEWLDGMK
jgi:hypothetical protein